MAGPTCFVLSPTALEADEILKELVRMVGNESDGESFWVRDTRGIGGIYAGEGRPFTLFFRAPRCGRAECHHGGGWLDAPPRDWIGSHVQRRERPSHPGRNGTLAFRQTVGRGGSEWGNSFHLGVGPPICEGRRSGFSWRQRCLLVDRKSGRTSRLARKCRLSDGEVARPSEPAPPKATIPPRK